MNRKNAICLLLMLFPIKALCIIDYSINIPLEKNIYNSKIGYLNDTDSTTSKDLKEYYNLANKAFLAKNIILATSLYRAFINYSIKFKFDKELWFELRNAYTYLGTIATNNAEYGNAIIYKKKALEITVQHKDINYLTSFLYLFDIAKNYYYLSDYPTALNYYNQAEYFVNQDKHIEDSYNSQIFNNIGLCYYKMGELKTSEYYINKSLELKKEASNELELANSYNNLGIIYMRDNLKEKALKNFLRAYSIYDSLGKQKDKAFMLNNIGNLFLKESSYDSCLYYYEQSYSIRKVPPIDTIELIQSLNNLSLTKLKLDNSKDARELADFSTKLNSTQYILTDQKIKSINDYLISLSILIEINSYNYNKTKNIKYLIESHEIFLNSLKPIVEAIPLEQYSTRSFFLNQNKRVFDSAINSEYLLDSIAPLNYPRTLIITESFKALLAANAILNLCIGTTSESENTLNSINHYWETASTIAQINENRWKQTLLPLDTILSRFSENSKNNQNRDRANRNFLLKYLISIKEKLEIFRCKEPEEAYIDYYFAVDKLFITTFTNSHFQTCKEEINVNINKLIYNQLLNIQTLEVKKLKEASYNLFSILMNPIFQQIKSFHKLIIIPDCTISGLPFEVLISQKGDSDSQSYLINNFDISYRYRLISKRQDSTIEQITYSNEYVGMAPFDSTSNPEQSIQNTVNEINYAKELLSSKNRKSKILIGKEVTVGDLLSKDNLNSRIFQLSTHTLIPTNQFLFSSFLLSEESTNDLLYLPFFSSLSFNNDLLILSGCKTASNLINPENGYYSFLSAITKPTIKNLLGTLWNIYDIPAFLFSKFFLDKVIDGNSYSKSLSYAKRMFIQSKTYYHPIFWASFILYEND